MKKLLFSITIALLGTSLFAQNEEQIRLYPEEFSIGTVRSDNDSLCHKLRYTNLMADSLYISRIETTCNVSVEFPKRKIETFATDTIIIRPDLQKTDKTFAIPLYFYGNFDTFVIYVKGHQRDPKPEEIEVPLTEEELKAKQKEEKRKARQEAKERKKQEKLEKKRKKQEAKEQAEFEEIEAIMEAERMAEQAEETSQKEEIAEDSASSENLENQQ